MESKRPNGCLYTTALTLIFIGISFWNPMLAFVTTGALLLLVAVIAECRAAIHAMRAESSASTNQENATGVKDRSSEK